MLKNVLLVDDDPMALLMTKEIIKNECFSTEVMIAMNGLLALQELENFFNVTSKQEHMQAPTLIFLDINMPLMDGWEFLDHYTRCFSAKLPDTNVILLSGSIDEIDLAKVRKYPVVTKVLRKPMLNDNLNYLKKNYLLQQYFA